jgi:multidrug efflux pump subunit AcrA (membrane-fusion protein)
MTRGGWCWLVAGVIVTMLPGCGKREDKAAVVPPALPAAPAPATNIVQPVRPVAPEVPLLAGTVAELEGSAETPVIANESGYLVRQVCKENAIVVAGDALFLLDPRSFHPDAMSVAHDNAGLVKVVAPAGGAVGRALHGAGDWINAQDELATIATVDPIRAVFSMPHGSVLARQAFELTLDDGSVYPARGKLDSITTAGMNVGVCVVFPNPNRVLRPGQFVKVRGVAP